MRQSDRRLPRSSRWRLHSDRSAWVASVNSAPTTVLRPPFLPPLCWASTQLSLCVNSAAPRNKQEFSDLPRSGSRTGLERPGYLIETVSDYCPVSSCPAQQENTRTLLTILCRFI